ncbi:MAG: hypothetical protein COU47_01110 [Candidatus Niyogibacteria bacterium CG10_big_fil_rev_8_21_14_0_10_46_36]|uniref:Uncharacterized protein n=1 Tax=Candidatus Niyogibacteria bacterium CG10_big_fil_rev_8_21_14_0_10_46_36 TaxID=1974726 RepID=A0A2H0TFU2_9BACT|nr:MAG: hypothetical protein COU47_01110 [Candidatus Niyogibacteria bacterium CG10_big_fil_rev_8_21_14_0_10_46_36]
MEMEIVILILGWALGLLSVVLSDFYRDWRENKIARPALLEELHELRQRLVHHVFLIQHKHGTVDHKFIKWAHSALTQYKGANINSTESLINNLTTLLNLSKEEVDAIAQATKQQKDPRRQTGLRKHSLPMLETNMETVRKFNPILRGKILEIKTRVDFLNELIDETRYYFKLSFESGITPENYQIANQNLIETSMFYAARAKNIVDLIGEIPEK